MPQRSLGRREAIIGAVVGAAVIAAVVVAWPGGAVAAPASDTGSIPQAGPWTPLRGPGGESPDKQVACGCHFWCRSGSVYLVGCKNVGDCETCCNLWEAKVCGCYEDRVCGGGFGTVTALAAGRLQLQVVPSGAPASSPSKREVVTFMIPGGVDLKSGVFASRAELEQYLLEQYVEAVPVPDVPAEPPKPACDAPGVGDGTTGAPRILVVVPSSAAPGTPIAVGGLRFDDGAVPFVNSSPSLSVYGHQMQNIPLIGSISVGFTVVPPAAPAGPGDVRVEYCGQMSNRYPFTVN